MHTDWLHFAQDRRACALEHNRILPQSWSVKFLRLFLGYRLEPCGEGENVQLGNVGASRRGINVEAFTQTVHGAGPESVYGKSGSRGSCDASSAGSSREIFWRLIPSRRTGLVAASVRLRSAWARAVIRFASLVGGRSLWLRVTVVKSEYRTLIVTVTARC